MVRLVPMTQKEFEAFLEWDVRELAKERVRAGLWSEAESLPRSRKEQRALLPDGLKSRYHHFYTIQESDRGEAVGVLWFKANLDSSRASGFIFQLEIKNLHMHKAIYFFRNMIKLAVKFRQFFDKF